MQSTRGFRERCHLRMPACLGVLVRVYFYKGWAAHKRPSPTANLDFGSWSLIERCRVFFCLFVLFWIWVFVVIVVFTLFKCSKARLLWNLGKRHTMTEAVLLFIVFLTCSKQGGGMDRTSAAWQIMNFSSSNTLLRRKQNRAGGWQLGHRQF